MKKLVYLGSIACIAILATSVFAESSSAGESSLDLRKALAPQLDKVKELSLEAVPGAVRSLPVARGYKGIIQKQALSQVEALHGKLVASVEERLVELEESITATLAEELTLVPRGTGHDFFSSYLGVSAGRQTGPWADDEDSDPYLRGHIAGGFVGFGRFFESNLYLGSETFMNYSTGVFYPKDTYKYRNHYNVGFAIIPGYQIFHGFAYLRTGIVFGRVSRSTSPSDTYDFDEQKFGYQAGLGYNFYVTRRWHMRLDYAYDHYGQIIIKDENNADNKKKFKPAVNHYTVGAVYYLTSLNLDSIDAPHFPVGHLYGGAYMDIPNHFQDNSKDHVPGVAISEEEVSAMDGFLGGGHLGYTMAIFDTQGVFGVELYGNLTDRSFEEANDSGTKWKNTLSYGGSLMGGYLIKRSNLFYVRVGAGMGNFEQKTNKEETMKKIAMMYGVGGETMLTNRFTFRVEYSRDRYEDLTPADEHFTVAVNFYF